MLSPAALQTFDDLLVELNTVAAEVILPIFRSDLGIENKKAGSGEADYDPVTLADKGAEAAIRRVLAERHPDHGVIGEEYGEDRPDAEFVWVLDPIDGTRAFIAGLPVWTTLIALRHRGDAGAWLHRARLSPGRGVHRPRRRFAAASTARRGSTPEGASSGVALRDAIIATTDPDGYYRAERDPCHGGGVGPPPRGGAPGPARAATPMPMPWWRPDRSIWSSRQAL